MKNVLVILLVAILILGPSILAESSDKPTVELYVFSYCPYGFQMERATFPVVNLLGNKIDFDIRQIGAMHGDFEKVEAERQLCIKQTYSDKYLDYVSAFISDSSCSEGNDNCVATKINSIYTNLGIDPNIIDDCIVSDGESLYNSEVDNAQSKRVSGSPTLIVNGVQTDTVRSSEAVKEKICNAFDNPPSECSQVLDSNPTFAGFGAISNSSDGARCCDDEQQNPPENNQENPPEENNNQFTCNGCKFQETCTPLGYRLKNENNESVYCDISKNLEPQKTQNSSCQNDFECLSGQCTEGVCINLQKELEKTNSVLQEIINFLKGLFGFK